MRKQTPQEHANMIAVHTAAVLRDMRSSADRKQLGRLHDEWCDWADAQKPRVCRQIKDHMHLALRECKADLDALPAPVIRNPAGVEQ